MHTDEAYGIESRHLIAVHYTIQSDYVWKMNNVRSSHDPVIAVIITFAC